MIVLSLMFAPAVVTILVILQLRLLAGLIVIWQ